MVNFSEQQDNSNPLSSLAEMNKRMQDWMDSKPTYQDFNKELRLAEDDIMFGYFVANGDEGDKFIKIYRSHICDSISKNGKPFTTTRFCPVQSGENIDCPLCKIEHNDIKERMSMWFYVNYILHARMPSDGKSYQPQLYNNRNYFVEQVDDFKIWHASAWRESPWNDINMLGQMYKGLHNFQAVLATTGRNTSKRFKLYPFPHSSTLDPAIYQRAQTECEDLHEMLLKEVNTPVQLRPSNGAEQTQTAPPPFGQPAATPFIPSGGQEFNPGAVGTGSPMPPQTQSVQESPTQDDTADATRPMKRLF